MSWTPWWVDQSALLPAADSSWMWGGEPASTPAPAPAASPGVVTGEAQGPTPAAAPPTPSLADMMPYMQGGTPQSTGTVQTAPVSQYTEQNIRDMYAARGNTNPDAEGLAWWLQQANSGALQGQQLTDTFNAAFTGAQGQQTTGAGAATADPNAWLSGANSWLGSGAGSTSGGSYFDQATNKYYMPVYGQGGYNAATGDYSSGALTGWRGYDRLPGTNSKDYSNTPFTEYDATGKQTGTGKFGDIGGSDWIQNLALAGLIAGGGAVLGNAVGLIGAPGGAGSATGGAGGFLGEGVASGVPAWDQALGGSILNSGGAAAGVGGAAAGAGGSGASGVGGAGAGIGSVLGTAGRVLGTVGSIVGGGNTGGAGTGGGNTGNLLSILAGLLDRNSQGNASNDMLNWLNTQQGKIDSLYAPGSAETNLLRQTLERKDAAAGRNSQYGPREVDLAARIAQIKADATARLTSGIAGNYSSALNQGASRNAGILSALGALGGSGNPITNISSLVSSLGDLFGNQTTGGNGTISDEEIDNIINGFV